MLQPGVMREVCAWERGNCATITVNNISRENITIRAHYHNFIPIHLHERCHWIVANLTGWLSWYVVLHQAISQLMVASTKVLLTMLLPTVVWVVHTPPIHVHRAKAIRLILTFTAGGTTLVFYYGITTCPNIRDLQKTFTSLVYTSAAALWDCMC